MGLDAISVFAKLRPEATAGLTPAAFLDAARRCLPAFFMPREVLGSIAGQELERRLLSDARPGAPELWLGEQAPAGAPLTRLTPDFTLLEDLRGAGAVELLMRGGLCHRPPLPGGEVGWYGRVVLDPQGTAGGGFAYLVTVRLDWNDLGHGATVTFPFAGYPLTRHLPSVDASFRVRDTALVDVVEENRRTLAGALRQLPALLGVAAEAVEWGIESQRALHEADRRALAEWEAELGRS